jgi:hypothetical protein
LVSRVILYADALIGGTGSAIMEKGRSTSHAAQRGSPVGVVYVAMMVAVRLTGSSCVRARKVKGTMVGVRFPQASEGSTTVSAVK